MMSPEELQRAISELSEGVVSAGPKPDAQWVECLMAAPNEVIIGAIAQWVGHTGVTQGPDPLASRRDAAQALLQARLSTELSFELERLRNSIDEFARKSGTQTRLLIVLAVVIAILTGATLVAAFK